MQKYFISFLLGGLLVAGIAFAQNGEETGVDAVGPAETVTATDLGVEDAGILPTSRLYFFKEWGRGIKSFFTFDSVKKAELELRFANEKAAEAKKVQETNPHSEGAIKKAVENYQKSQERLRLRLESLKETSQNPNIDRLLDQLAEKTVRHEKVLEEIAAKAKDVDGVDELIQKAKERIEESVASGIKRDDPAKFATRLKKSLLDSTGEELKHVRSLAILDRISKKTPEGFKVSLEKLREEFSERAKEDIEEVLETETPEALQKALAGLPGDVGRRLHIIEEIQEKANKQATDALKNAAKAIEKTIKAEKRIAQKAAEQIEDAANRIEKLDTKMGEFTPVLENVSNLAATAKEHLARAEAALGAGKFGDAFGQARSAESAARNALRTLEELEKAEEEEEEKVAKAMELHQRRREKLEEPKERLQEKVKEEKIQSKSSEQIPEETAALAPSIVELKLEADDSGFYPSSEIRVPKGAQVILEFKVRSQGVYFGGLDFRSDKFKTQTVKPGDSTRAEFVADKSFEFTSWWPASERLKATGKVIVE